MTPPQQRITRGFSMGEEDGGEKPPARRIRTRQQIMNGEGKRPPATVELKLLAGNPFNPRDELTEIEETAESLRAKGQIQPVTVVRRAAFLGAYPGQEGELGEEAEYVVIDGNRRLAAAPVAGLSELRIDVNDDLAASAADILESALIANIHRVDVPALDQARAIRELLAKHGTQEKVAKRLGKSGAWVSQRLALLELPEDLQEKVESKELSVKDGRRIGRLPKDQQRPEAAKALNRVKTPRKPRGKTAAPVESGTPAPEAMGTVLPHQASAEGEAPATALNPVKTPAQGAGSGTDATAQGKADQPKRLPYDDAFSVVTHLHLKMDPTVFADGARVWLRILREQHPDAYSALLQELTQQEQPA
ncbi:ParB family chromosome partitioning protein [Streptomyces canus]|uniref:ParB family chromosome partitioning protein n=1 Tax=Streptomyces canus TaxID=58343 RepID=A0AAW8F7K6_9ACTN|nr:ParB/RepB/Spo0J family partition protein [Streptomyces canus]MDQ0904672.1 ParB family chromosome partitioning protein [Streptomyces canus]